MTTPRAVSQPHGECGAPLVTRIAVAVQAEYLEFDLNATRLHRDGEGEFLSRLSYLSAPLTPLTEIPQGCSSIFLTLGSGLNVSRCLLWGRQVRLAPWWARSL